MPHAPINDPSRGDNLADRSVAYVRSSRLLRVCLGFTVVDHLVAVGLVVAGEMPISLAGFLGLMSVLSWFFAVCLPLMNRSLRTHIGRPRRTEWTEALELFFRVILALQTGLYTLLLTQTVLAVIY